jgi:hypothetical protein
MEIWQDIKIALDADDVLRGEGADPETARTKRPALLKAVSAALHEGNTQLHPTVISHTVKVVEHRHERILLKGGQELTGPLAAHHLAGAEQIILVVCTIGSQLENMASSWMEKNPVLGLALDGLGNAAVEKVAQQVCARLAERAQAKSLQASTPLSPGEPDWPVEVGLPQIFALLDPSKAGVTLTSGGMMVPKKSVSFVVGVGPNMSQTDSCDICSLKETCRYRHA